MFGQKRLSREGGVEIVVKELSTRMSKFNNVTCLNRSGHKISENKVEGIVQKSVFTIDKKGLAAVSSSFFASLIFALANMM